MKTLKLATRGSRLALAQARLVQSALEASGQKVELLQVTTHGDRDRTSPLVSIGGQGLFVREVERCLLDGRADLAVHSGKDLPYTLAEGLIIAGVPKAASAADVLICRRGTALHTIGTGSPRRILACRSFYPDAEYKNIRGNVDTRLQKLRDGAYDAILLARAGLERLTDENGISAYDAVRKEFDVREFSPTEFLPAPCQGILAVECRAEDESLITLLRQISDPVSLARFDAERRLFGLLQADCSVPVGVHAEAELTGQDAEPAYLYHLSAMLRDRRVSRSGTDLQALCEEIRKELIP